MQIRIRNYAITLQGDNGSVEFNTASTSAENAIKTAMKSEGCPISAVSRINRLNVNPGQTIIFTSKPEVIVLMKPDFSFVIFQEIANGKFKPRRTVNGRPLRVMNKAGKMIVKRTQIDKFSFVVLKPFESFEDAKTNALNFVDNFLKLI